MSISVLEVAEQRTAELDAKPDAQSWLFSGLLILGVLAFYLLYAEPFGDKEAMRASSVAAMLAVFMCAWAALVSDLRRNIRLRTSAVLALVAIAIPAIVFTSTT